MKFITNKAILSEALSVAGRFTGGKAIVPILDYFLFEIDNDSVTIVGTNMEIFTSTKIEIQPCGFKYSVAIPIDLADLVKKLPDSPISISIKTAKLVSKITINAGDGEYEMTGESADNFPNFDYKSASSFKMKSSDLKFGIQRTIFTVSSDKLRPAMQGIYLQIGDNEVTFTATDSHRLSTYTCKNKTSIKRNIVIPAKLMQALPSFAMDDEVEITLDDSKIMLHLTEDTSIQSILVDDSYPNYEAIIPEKQPNELQVDRLGLIAILSRISGFSNQVSHTVQLSTTDNKLTVTAENRDYGKAAKECIDCTTEGDMNMAFNGKHLMEILQRMSSDTAIITFTEYNRAVLLKDQDDKKSIKKNLMLIMPVMPPIGDKK